jgi:hypothetical protein
MTDAKATGLVQSWVATTDAHGQTHLEARWAPAPQVQASPHAA